jgi:hypothetical protein
MATHGISSILAVVPDWFWLLLLAHAVTTFPTPKNAYGQWLLGVVKWIVGQRISGVNAFNGYQTEVTAVTDAQKRALQNGSTMEVVKTDEGILKPVSKSD